MGKTKQLVLGFDKIAEDYNFNGRRVYGKARGSAPGQSDDDMVQDFLDRAEAGHDPLLQPLRIYGPLDKKRLLEILNKKTSGVGVIEEKDVKGAEYILVYGYRRLRNLKAALLKLGKNDVVKKKLLSEVRCEVMEPTTDFEADMVQMALDNVTENAGRQDLMPWEQAEQWATMLKDFPQLSAATLAKSASKSKSHVNNMVRLRAKLCPELWEEFRKKGDAMKIADLLKACTKPREDQPAAYEEARKESAGGRPPKAPAPPSPGSKAKNGGGEPEPPTEPEWEVDWKKVEKWAKEATLAVTKAEESGDENPFAEGAQYALFCLLNQDDWSKARLSVVEAD